MNVFRDITKFLIDTKTETITVSFEGKEVYKLREVCNSLADSGYKIVMDNTKHEVTINKPVVKKSYEFFRKLMEEFIRSEDTTKQFAVIGDDPANCLIEIAEKDFGLEAHIEYFNCGGPVLVINKRFAPKSQYIPGQLINHVSEPEDLFIDAVYKSMKKHIDYVPLKTGIRVADDLWNELRKDLLIVKR